MHLPSQADLNSLTKIEGQLGFYERALAERNRSNLSALSVVGAILALLVRAVIANTRELQRINSFHK